MLLLLVALLSAPALAAVKGPFYYNPYPLGRIRHPTIKGEELDMRCTDQNVELLSRISDGRRACFNCTCDTSIYPEGRLNCMFTRDRECPNIDTCPVLDPHDPEKQCCKTCKDCEYSGDKFKSGESMQSSQDACRLLTCVGGLITTSRIECARTSCENPQRLSGFCCPLCPSNVTGNGIKPVGVTDPCVTCDCANGWCHCFKAACPVLNCPKAHIKLVKGECCPTCTKPRQFTELSGQQCDFRGEQYQDEHSFRPDPCTQCKCQAGSIICRRFVCPETTCLPTRVYYDHRMCCPLCRFQDPLNCTYDHVTYKHDESWRPDACTECSCSNGEVRCTRKSCPHAHGCPKGYKLVEKPGQCCPECEEKDATCTVFGDPHYETFDGHTFNFQGTCKYVLAKTCSKRQSNLPPFAIIVQNDPRRTAAYSWTKRVTVRLTSRDRITMLPKKRVRYNGKTVNLHRPFVKLGKFSLMIDKQMNLVLRTVSGSLSSLLRGGHSVPPGLKVIWDGNSFAEVSISPLYKNQLCGLCGNFNHDDSDDLTYHLRGEARRSAVPPSPYEFGHFWARGGPKRCRLPADKMYLEVMQKKRRQRARKNKRKRLKNQNSKSSNLSLLHRRRPLAGGSPFPLGLPRQPPRSDSILSVFNRVGLRKPSLAELEKRRRILQAFGRPAPQTPSCDWEKKGHAQSQCKLLRSPIFNLCHPEVPVGRFYTSCRVDICECPSTGKCYCESLLAYGRACAKAGVEVDWQKYTDCLSQESTCPMSGAYFSPCNPPMECQSTCRSRGQDPCTSPCVPGCACFKGTLLHGDRCVHPADCPLLDDVRT